jgi:hypothetical protein
MPAGWRCSNCSSACRQRQLDDWLRRHGLQNGEPLWKSLHVEAGWEDAVEAVLRERLSALPAKVADPAWSRIGRAAN